MEVVLQNIEAASSSHTTETRAQIILMRSSRIAYCSLLLKEVGGRIKRRRRRRKPARGNLKNG